MPKHQDLVHSTYSTSQIYDMVADIEKYPEFLPWCSNARIINRKNNILEAELVVSYKKFSQNYISKVELSPPDELGHCSIEVKAITGPFKHLINKWEFIKTDTGCNINFLIDIAFSNIIFEQLLGSFFDNASTKMVSAFEKRADFLYKGTK